MKHAILLAMSLVVCAGCSTSSTLGTSGGKPKHEAQLQQVLDSQSNETKARYAFRNPAETLAFFGIEPGMTVVELLPGEGWYSQILAPYLGSEGTLIGLDYPAPMLTHFDWATPEFIENRKSWPNEWASRRSEWGGASAANMVAYSLDAVPESLHGTADSVLIIRALHGLSRFESAGGFMTSALQTSYDLLKPGGTLGIVQHRAPDTASDTWADGSHGYMREDLVKAAMEKAGFEFVNSSTVNRNPKDKPSETDSVWRLPPSLADSKDNPLLQSQYVAIGESDRMTLLFRKPATARK